MRFTFTAFGHPAILSTHPTTLEITREEHLTRQGDCIVAVRSECGLADLPPPIRRALSNEHGRGRLIIRVRDYSFALEGRGASGLTFAHPSDIVVRKSGFVSDRTLMVHADKAAIDIPKEVVRLLRTPAEKVTIEISTNG